MDINLRLFSRLSQWVNTFFAPKATLKTESDDAQKGLISLKTIANQYQPKTGQDPINETMSSQSIYTAEDFVGREAQTKQISDVINLWCNHHGEISAIVAPAGAGLSAFLGQIPSLLANINTQQQDASTSKVKPLPEKGVIMSFYNAPLSASDAIANVCYCFDMQPPATMTDTTITDIIIAINKLPAQLIVIDDLHKLMLRMMGNAQALVTFATIVMETRKHHCWILGCEKFAWQRLSTQYQITHFIKHVITFDYFNAKELASIQTKQLVDLGLISDDYLILKTDEAEPNQTQNLSEATHTESEKDDDVNPYDDQLKQLHMISQGHPKLAKLLLQYSLTHQADIAQSSSNNKSDNGSKNNSSKVTDNNSKQCTDICKVNASVLPLCQDNDLFSLAEIYIHGGLRVAQHAHIFAQTIEQSSLQLAYLARQGLIIAQYSQRDFAQHFYFITPALSKIIASHLVNNNKLFN
ncbi:hypothetical protein [Shewanella frigidimarina]|uniref:Uncharacterized protein n=1 Tax=Shewanella frigidimarina TaxID=56812 RepID=A0A106BYZ9_SHEFR|nr:hypothetical protein [Shewanella frigidimarina]KVX01200.1 hypothetical protein AWJ07_07040 [Shewanella frigidimarina]